MNKLDFASFEEIFAPAVKINEIALSYTEKLVEMNMAVMRKQADVAMATWRAALSVKDATEANNYVAAQSEVARELVEGYVADAKAVSAISQQVANDVYKVVTEGIEKVAKKAA
ncbi:MAG: phasin family protein [Sedimenticolaceae bacterium]